MASLRYPALKRKWLRRRVYLNLVWTSLKHVHPIIFQTQCTIFWGLSRCFNFFCEEQHISRCRSSHPYLQLLAPPDAVAHPSVGGLGRLHNLRCNLWLSSEEIEAEMVDWTCILVIIGPGGLMKLNGILRNLGVTCFVSDASRFSGQILDDFSIYRSDDLTDLQSPCCRMSQMSHYTIFVYNRNQTF